MTVRIPPLFCWCGREMRLEKAGIRLRVISLMVGPTAIVEAEEWKCTACDMRIRRIVPGTTPITAMDPGFEKAEWDEEVRTV